MNYLRSILRLTSGDFVAKALYFVIFVYLARALEVDSYGQLEFAISLLSYFVLLADGGVELWATRAAAQGSALSTLVSTLIPLRLLMAILVYIVLALATVAVPSLREFQIVLLLFGLLLPAQAVNLKWVFMGQHKMGKVVRGLVVSQIIFALLALAFVRDPAGLVWVPLARLAGEIAAAAYFYIGFRREHGVVRWGLPLPAFRRTLTDAAPLGAASALAIMSFNFDMVLLGFYRGTATVGLYAAAYKPVSAVLAAPVSYFLGLFPALSRAYADSLTEYTELVERSFRILTLMAAPVAAAGTFLAADGIMVLFGDEYAGAAPALRLLSLSAALTIMRGTFRQALNAAGQQRLDLRCAIIAVSCNVAANLLLIPQYGMIGAAVATVGSELIWFVLAAWYVRQRVVVIPLAASVWRPAGGALLMAGCFYASGSLAWFFRIVIAGVAYGVFLLVAREPELLIWLRRLPAMRQP